MRKLILLAGIILIAGCGEKQEESWFTAPMAIKYFRKVEDACNRDNGKLWGKNLYAPVMYVDYRTRKITANLPDQEGLLKEKDGVYTGTYPRELLIRNYPVRFGGTLYALAPLPQEEDEFRIVNRAVHGLFHCFQESTGYTSSGYNTSNMDDKNARLWVKLEWKALKRAVTADSTERNIAIRDALVFKGSYRELFPASVKDGIKFENYEGLAAFTYILISSSSYDEYKARMLEFLDRIYGMQSYSRTYGALTGALYAFLLNEMNYDFKTIRSEEVDLAGLVKELYGVQLPEVCRDVAGSIALNYEVEKIQAEELQRETEIKERIYRRISTFTEKPVVFFELESPYFDFEDSDIRPMDTLGTLYMAMRISDNWGKLSVDEGGCLVSNNLRYLRVTAKGYKFEKNRAEGEGWHLTLNDGWELTPVNGNYFVRKLVP